MKQAQELIKHSKETFLVDKSNCDTNLCACERLAWNIHQ
jgi:hypothetical protein